MKFFIVHLLIIGLMFPNLAFAQFWGSSVVKQTTHIVNDVPNAGFENGLAEWTKTGTSTLDKEETFVYEGTSAKWTALASGEFLRSKLTPVTKGLEGESCLASFRYLADSLTVGAVVARITNGTTSVTNSDATLVQTNGKFGRVQMPMTCPSGSSLQIELESTAAAVVYVDQFHVGTNYNIGSGAIDVNSHAGSIMAWPHADIPDGWLEADGSSQLRTQYPDLFARIGVTYGNVDGTHFNLPDYRGQFLRGHDDGAAIDPDAAGRSDRGDGTTGDNVGTKQSHELDQHLHNITVPNYNVSNRTTSNDTHNHSTLALPRFTSVSSGSSVGWANKSNGTGTAFSRATDDDTHSHTVSIDHDHGSFDSSNTGGNETRPTNVGVKWIIKHTDSGTQTVVTVDSIKSPLTAGMIMAWPNDVLPTGWIKADGSSQLRTDYPDLFAEIGVKYGNVDGTHFNLPDYRGQFLRGVADGEATDPDRASRTDRGDGTTGDNVGTKQVDDTAPNDLQANVANHTHTDDITSTGNDAHFHSGRVKVASGPVGGSGWMVAVDNATSSAQATSTVDNMTNSDTHNHSIGGGVTSSGSHTATVTSPIGGNETRPTNIGVNWIIKTTTDVLDVAVAFPEATETISGGVKLTQTFAVGSVQQSILDEADFQAEMGSTDWVLWGAATDITGSKLAAYVGNTLPDASGKFLRNVGTNAAAVRVSQGFATAEGNLNIDGAISINRTSMNTTNHTHSSGTYAATAGVHTSGTIQSKTGTGTFTSNRSRSTTPNNGGGVNGVNASDVIGSSDDNGGTQTLSVSNGTIDVTSTDTETRPVNISVNTYIKIN